MLQGMAQIPLTNSSKESINLPSQELVLLMSKYLVQAPNYDLAMAFKPTQISEQERYWQPLVVSQDSLLLN